VTALAGIRETPGLDAYLEALEERLEAAVSSHRGTVAAVGAEALAAGGKRLRPLLVYLASPPGAPSPLAAGVAVELVHMAALVHDDVLDRAALRRGQPTVFATAGRDAATATGDFLFARAFGELAATGEPAAVQALSAAASALARGELMQRADAWRADVPEERYLDRCTLKTARLFDAACRLGALFGDPPSGDLDEFGSYGERIGLAFQIFDDVLDVAGPVERTGKRRGTDLLDGTVTLPLIIARRRDERLAAVDLRSITESGEAEDLCDRIAATGALETAREAALGHVDEAKATLRRVKLADRRREALELVAEGVVERYG